MIKNHSIKILVNIFVLYLFTAGLHGCDTFSGIFSKKDPDVENAYKAYRAALKSGDIESLKKHISQEKVYELDGDNAAVMLELARELSPPHVTVTGTYVKGDTATLTASATDKGSTMNGTIHLLKENGTWKVYEEKWEVKIGMTESPIGAPDIEEENLPPNVVRPSNFYELIGTWEGKDIDDGSEWVFTFSKGYDVKAEGPHGSWYRGKAAIHWDLGVSSDGSVRVPPGAGILDVDISDASRGDSVGKTSLAAFAIYGDTMKLCGGEPGKTQRPTTFEDTKNFRCFELTRTSGEPGALEMHPDENVPERVQVPAHTFDEKKDSDATAAGEAIIVKDGIKEKYILNTGFFSETRFDDPKRAKIQFQIPAEKFSNARRIEMTLDATKTGEHYADGEAINDSMFNNKELKIGEQTPHGRTAIFSFIADGGQIFPPKKACIINVTSSYTGAPDGVFAGEISDCTVHSAGIDYTISSVIFMMRGIPSH